MPNYEFHVKGNIPDSPKVAVRIVTPKFVSKKHIDLMQDMRFDDAREYCKRIVGAQLLQSHIKE